MFQANHGGVGSKVPEKYSSGDAPDEYNERDDGSDVEEINDETSESQVICNYVFQR